MMKVPASEHVLLFHEERDIMQCLTDWTLALGYRATGCCERFNIFSCLKETRAEILILDQNILDSEGIELIEKIRSEYPYLQCVFLIGCEEQRKLLKLQYSDDGHFVLKPVEPNKLDQMIRLCIQKIRKRKNP